VRFILIFLFLFNLKVFAQNTIDNIDSISSASDLDQYESETFMNIYSNYGGEKKNCGYTRFPEEYTQDFKQGRKFPELKKYYDLKREVSNLERVLNPEDDTEYVRRRDEYRKAQAGIQNFQEELLQRVPLDKIRNEKLKELFQSDPAVFEKHILDAGDNAFLLGFFNEHPEVREVISQVEREFQQEREELPRAEDHFFAYGEGVEKNAARARRLLPSKRRSLAEMESNKEIMELSERYDERELDEVMRNYKEYKRSKNLTIVFEGTGQYSPKLERNLKLIQAKLGINPTQEQIEKATDKALEISDDKAYMISQGGKDTWSGTIRGVIAKGLYANKEGSNMRNSQWLYLPSEQDNFTAAVLDTGTGVDMMSRKEAYSRGLQCLSQYLKLYPDTNLSIVGHSSGVKAAIDFAEKLKKKGITNIDMLGIDPVDNMMEGALEGGITGAFVRMDKIATSLVPECWLTDEERRRKNATVHVGVITSKEREDLKKPSNASSFVVFYQTQDWKGLEIPVIEFGIHGSSVIGAENHHLRFNLGSGQHHGMITQEDRVIDEFRSTLGR